MIVLLIRKCLAQHHALVSMLDNVFKLGKLLCFDSRTLSCTKSIVMLLDPSISLLHRFKYMHLNLCAGFELLRIKVFHAAILLKCSFTVTKLESVPHFTDHWLLIVPYLLLFR